jgi:hypothetical protein
VSYIAHIQIGDVVGTVLHLPEELADYQPQMADAAVLWPYEAETSWDTLPINPGLVADFVLARPA